MRAEFSRTHVEIARADHVGSKYATLLSAVDQYGPAGTAGTTLDYGIGLHPALSATPDSNINLSKLFKDLNNHTTYVSDHISDPIRRNVLLVSLRGLCSRLKLLSGEPLTPTQMVYDAYNVALPEEPYDDSWITDYYKQEILPLIPDRFFPDGNKTPEHLLSAYNAFKNTYRLRLLGSPGDLDTQPEERLKGMGRYVARLIFERAQEKKVLTFDNVDAALDPLIIEPVIDSAGGEGGYFRFDQQGKPTVTLNWQTKSEPTPWELLLAQTHELAGHYQEYSEKIAFAWKKGWTEWAVAGLYSPAAFFSEGVAQVMPKYLFSDAESVLGPVLKIYEKAGQKFDERSRADILNLIKIHQLVNFNPEFELVKINSIKLLEHALQITNSQEREVDIDKAKKYYQDMCLESKEHSERRVKFIQKYGGYIYVYPISMQAYWEWFRQQGQTPEAMLRLMREPLVLSLL